MKIGAFWKKKEKRKVSCNDAPIGQIAYSCVPERTEETIAFFIVYFFAGDSFFFCRKENEEKQTAGGLRLA